MIFTWEKRRRFYNPSASIFTDLNDLFMVYGCRTLTKISPILVSEPEQKKFYESRRFKGTPHFQPRWVKYEREGQKRTQEGGYYDPYFEDTELALVIDNGVCIYNIWQSSFVLTYKLLVSWYATRCLPIYKRSIYDIVDDMKHRRVPNIRTLPTFLRDRSIEINYNERDRLSAIQIGEKLR